MTLFLKMPNVFHLIINPAALEYYEDIKEYVMGLTYFQYLRVVEHIGQSQKHYHMFLQLSKSLPRLSIRRLHGAHVVPRDDKKYPHGSTKAILRYINCEDNSPNHVGVTAVLIDEEGELKPQGGNYTVGYLEELGDDIAEMPAIYYNIHQKIQNKKKSDTAFYEMLDMIEQDSLRPVEVVYFIGKPGTGKTYNAYKYALSKFTKEEITKVTIQNNFFEFVGSNKDKCLVVEEFRPSQLHPSSLLQFTDKYGYSCPIKGGYKYVKPECIIICSIIDPRRLYREEKEELNEQFTRRIKHLYEVTSNHSYYEILLNQVHIGGYPIGYRTDFNQLEEYEVTDDWDGTRTIIN